MLMTRKESNKKNSAKKKGAKNQQQHTLYLTPAMTTTATTTTTIMATAFIEKLKKKTVLCAFFLQGTPSKRCEKVGVLIYLLNVNIVNFEMLACSTSIFCCCWPF